MAVTYIMFLTAAIAWFFYSNIKKCNVIFIHMFLIIVYVNLKYLVLIFLTTKFSIIFKYLKYLFNIIYDN